MKLHFFSPSLFLLLGMACHSIQYPPGHFRSAVPAVPSHPPAHSSLEALQTSFRTRQKIGVLSTFSEPQIPKSTRPAALKIFNSMPARSSTWYTHPKMWTLLCPVLWASFRSSARCSGHAQHQTCSTTATGTSSDCSPLSLHRESSLQSIFLLSFEWGAQEASL